MSSTIDGRVNGTFLCGLVGAAILAALAGRMVQVSLHQCGERSGRELIAQAEEFGSRVGLPELGMEAARNLYGTNEPSSWFKPYVSGQRYVAHQYLMGH